MGFLFNLPKRMGQVPSNTFLLLISLVYLNDGCFTDSSDRSQTANQLPSVVRRDRVSFCVPTVTAYTWGGGWASYTITAVGAPTEASPARSQGCFSFTPISQRGMWRGHQGRSPFTQRNAVINVQCWVQCIILGSNTSATTKIPYLALRIHI